MSDFEPETDFPEYIEEDDASVESAARTRDASVQARRKRAIQIGIVVLTLILLAFRLPLIRVIGAMISMYLILIIGMAVLGSFARPVPEAPPPGKLRKVKLTYRCSTCGAELRMTLADERLPQAPRHCADEMELTTPLEDV